MFLKKIQLKFNQYLLELYNRYIFTTNANKIDDETGVRANECDERKKIAVYSCIVGGYDNPVEPTIIEEGIDYFMFTDSEIPEYSVWTKIDIRNLKGYNRYSAKELNRRIKLLPYQYLKGYDYTVYVDGNIRINTRIRPVIGKMNGKMIGVHFHHERDCAYDEAKAVRLLNKADKRSLRKQIKDYKEQKFPRHYGLYANGVLICNLNSQETIVLLREWWKSYYKYKTRDQICLPYAVWKCGTNKKDIYILGNNVFKNKRFVVEKGHNS